MSNNMPGTPLSCSVQIDYTNVGEDKILPYVIELDLENSVLTPVHGENQRFCYQITGVGEDISLYSDLSHFVLDLCGDIPENYIENITVTINEKCQTIQFGEGGNVELRVQDNPDPDTGHSGLMFNFGLNKATGLMTVCFELTKTYPISANPIYLYGDGFTVSGLSICGPVSRYTDTFERVVHQQASICVPVHVSFFANVGSTTTSRLGTPIIAHNTNHCCGIPNGTCQFTITQKLCIAVPIEFGANSTIGSPSVVSLHASDCKSLDNYDNNEKSSINEGSLSDTTPDAASEAARLNASPHSERSDSSNIKSLFNPYFRKKP